MFIMLRIIGSQKTFVLDDYCTFLEECEYIQQLTSLTVLWQLKKVNSFYWWFIRVTLLHSKAVGMEKFWTQVLLPTASICDVAHEPSDETFTA